VFNVFRHQRCHEVFFEYDLEEVQELYEIKQRRSLSQDTLQRIDQKVTSKAISTMHLGERIIIEMSLTNAQNHFE
jgi:hypothetical protein